jgi:peptidoglycan-N-acetylglucosamine deacetylase
MKNILSILLVICILAIFYVIQLPKAEAPAPSPLQTTTPHTDFKEISKLDPAKNEVMITIDAGRGQRSADGLLKALAKHKIKGSFFIVGSWAEQHTDIVRRIAQEGHEIFNHSYSHADYTTLTPDEIKANLIKNDEVLFKMTGQHTQPYFRAPYGYRNEMVKQAAAEIGYQHIYWSVDPRDWDYEINGEIIKERVLSKIHPGSILMLHIDDVDTGDIADELFTELKNRGYKLVSLSEALK